MKKFFIISLLFLAYAGYAQKQSVGDTSKMYKKRALENAEIEILSSFYTQDGDNASVTGGIGTEKLNDFASDLSISIPLKADGILKIDGTVSAYTSASSSNLNPFTGASGDDDDEDGHGNSSPETVTGSPWVEASGASRKDVWVNVNAGYSHYSDDRNKIWNGSFSFANEFDYTSFGFGAGYTQLFNEKNTEVGIKANVYLDKWRPQYPTEIITYLENTGDLEADFFNGVSIYDQAATAVDKNGPDVWSPYNPTLADNQKRNTYSLSLSVSQILSKNAQFSFFSDIIIQQGLLANPMQRVYFADRSNYYIGNPESISEYTSYTNEDVFQLADDIERLPDKRIKIPVGMRFNYFINEYLVIRTYYRYYLDSWDLMAHTINIELPIKLSPKFTLYPSYRFYTQQAAKYFAAYEQHVSTEQFYTSDYDLLKFNANQYGLGIKYTDLFSKAHIGKLKVKNLNLNYNFYRRNTGLQAHIVTLGAKFFIEK